MSVHESNHHCASRRRRFASASMLVLLALSPWRAVGGAEPVAVDPPLEVHRPIDLPAGDRGGLQEAPVSDRGVLPYLAHLVRLSGNGMLDVERAAFLVEEDGRFRCELWPFDNGHRRTTYRGAVPAGTVAIAHTHPIELPAPSEHDRRETVRLGIPMLVASRWSVYEIAPDGQVRALAGNRRWMGEAGEDGSCELRKRSVVSRRG